MKNDLAVVPNSLALMARWIRDYVQRQLSCFRPVGAGIALTLTAVAVAGCGERAQHGAAPPTESTSIRPARATPAPSLVTAPPAAQTAKGTDATIAPLPALALSAEGIELVDATSGATQRVLFGSDLAPLIETLNRVYRAVPERATNGECGGGPLEFAIWPGVLNVLSQQGKFVGWSVNQSEQDRPMPKLATLDGIGVGSTRSELEAVYAAQVAETTLGTEFAAGELYGVLASAKPDAKITAMWAGTSCVFR